MSVLPLWRDSLVSLGRRPSALLGVTAALLAIALAGTAITAAPLFDTLSSQPDPTFAPGVFDQPMLVDLPWRDQTWLVSTGMAWSLAGLATLLLFALGDAVLIRAAAGPWPGARAAWGDALRRSPALLAISGGSLAYLMLCHAALQVVLGGALQAWGRRVESETIGIFWWALPELLFVLAALPAKLTADLARATIAAQGGGSGWRAARLGLRGVVTRWQPWAIRGIALALDAAVIAGFAAVRSVWDPRTAAFVGLALAAIVLLLGIRLIVHASYLGSLARWQRGN